MPGPVFAKLLVSEATVGGVIGKGGSNLSKAEEISKARIAVSRGNQLFPGTTDRVLCISGGVIEVLVALHVLLESLRASGMSMLPRTGKADELRLLVPRETAGAVIGTGGAAIRQAAEESGALVVMSCEAAGLPERTVSIMAPTEAGSGPLLKGVGAVLNAVVGLPAYREKANDRLSYYEGNNDKRDAALLGWQAMVAAGPAPRNAVAASLLLSSVAMGPLLGEGGECINELRVRSGADLQLKKGSESVFPGTTDRVLTIGAATAGQVTAAVHMLLDRMESQGVMLHSADGQNLLVRMLVPVPLVGGLMGPRGSRLQRLASQAGTLTFVSRGCPGVMFRIVHIFGREPANLAAAVTAIAVELGTRFPAEYTAMTGANPQGQPPQQQSQGSAQQRGGGPQPRQGRPASAGSRPGNGSVPRDQPGAGGWHAGPGVGVRSASGGGGSGMMSPPGERQQEEAGEALVPIPEVAISEVAGASGQELQQLQQVVGVGVRLSAPGAFLPGTRDRYAIVTGPREAVAIAEQLIRRKVTAATASSTWR